jgi:RNA polymerase sigma factor (sigma-70 family)
MTRMPVLRGSPERALESLYKRHAAEIYRYALAMLESPADAEDVTQTTFLNAYRALLRGDRPRAAGRWLRVIAHNLCLQHFRQASRRPREVVLEEEQAALVEDENRVQLDDLIRAMGQIPVNQRAALVMRELEGRPITEIATILSVSASAVETLLFRARRSVREQLEGSLTCVQAELAISRQLDGSLPRAERGQLRAHLRQCEPCAHVARSLRAQRRAMRSLGLLPLPGALAWSKFGAGAAVGGVASASAGSAATGAGWLTGAVAAKLAGATLLAGVVAGAGYEVATDHPWSGARPAASLHARPSGSGPPSRAGRSAGVGSGRSVFAALVPSSSQARRFGVVASGIASGLHGTMPRRVTVTSTPASAITHGAGTPRPSAGHGGTHVERNAHPHPVNPGHPVHPAHPAKPLTSARPDHAANPVHTPKRVHAAKPAHAPKAVHAPKRLHATQPGRGTKPVRGTKPTTWPGPPAAPPRPGARSQASAGSGSRRAAAHR